MILAINDHKRRIEVGYGLEGILNDAKVGDIGRAMVPWLQRGEYGPGLLEGEQQIANVIAADAHVTLTPLQHPVQQPAPQRGRNDWLGIVIFFVIIFFILGGGRAWRRMDTLVLPRQYDGWGRSLGRRGLRRWWGGR